MRKLSTLLFLALLPLTTWAYDFQVDQLCYNINDENPTEVTVTYQQDLGPDGAYPSLSGAITIPSTITYNGNTYTVTSIGERAFRECSSLTSVTIPEGVTSIEGTAFEGCSSLTSVTIPNSVTSVGLRAFCFCSSLTSVTIGNSVTSIVWTFWGCSSLTSVTIGNSVTSIGDYAFRYCSSLTSVNIPNSVTSIGGGAFEGCSSLTSVTIPNSVTSIEGIAFRDCSSLTSVTIGNNVTGIGNTAFGYCSSLIEIIVLATNPPVTDTNAFQEVNRDIPLYVPAASIEAYRTADVWKEFTNILPIESHTHKQLEITITGNGTIQYGEITLTKDTTLYIEQEMQTVLQLLPDEGYAIAQVMYNRTDYTANVNDEGMLTLPIMEENGSLVVDFQSMNYENRLCISDVDQRVVFFRAPKDNYVTYVYMWISPEEGPEENLTPYWPGSRAIEMGNNFYKFIIPEEWGESYEDWMIIWHDGNGGSYDHQTKDLPFTMRGLYTGSTFETVRNTAVVNNLCEEETNLNIATIKIQGSDYIIHDGTEIMSGAYIAFLDNENIILYAPDGYIFESVIVDDVPISIEDNHMIALNTIFTDVEISVVLVPMNYNISVYCEGSNAYTWYRVAAMDDFARNISILPGSQIQSVTLNGNDVTDQLDENNRLLISNIDSDKTLIISTCNDVSLTRSADGLTQLRAWRYGSSVYAELDETVRIVLLYDGAGNLLHEYRHTGDYKVITFPVHDQAITLTLVDKDGKTVIHKLM